MFERDYMYLASEVTDRMAADIYTKAFSDSRKWKHACMQIGLLEPEMLTDPETFKMVTSSFGPKKGTVQAATGSIDGIPTFPYTKVPIMPPDLWWQELSSKEGLHEHEGMIWSSWQKFRNSCGTSHHSQCNILLADGGCVPLGFCAEVHGRKLRVVLNPRCSGSASTSTSSVQYGSFI